MKDQRKPCEAPDEPWRDLPGDPWLRPGTLRTERNGRLIAVVVTDPSNAPPGTFPDPGPWMHHWLMPAAEQWPVELTPGERLCFEMLNGNTGDAKTVENDPALRGMFPPGTPLIVRTVNTNV